jgi:sirohydrochlorin cobaltochelatase
MTQNSRQQDNATMTSPNSPLVDCGILMVAHGARAAGWDAPFQLLLTTLSASAANSKQQFGLAFLEHKLPDVATGIAELTARGCKHITLVPMLLGVGMHAREDLPRHLAEARTAHPQVQFVLKPTLGEDAGMLAAMATFVRSAQ